MIILGIDPGTALTGYGLISKESHKIKLIDYGCIITKNHLATAQRLQIIDQQLKSVIKKYRPEKAAIEDIFFFKNLKTAVKVSQARGVVLARVCRAKLTIEEYSPLQIKQAVTGYGRADKKQIQQMVKIILDLKEIPKPDDAADALAAAICCAHSINNYQFKCPH